MAMVLPMRLDPVAVRLPKHIGAPEVTGVTPFERYTALRRRLAQGLDDARRYVEHWRRVSPGDAYRGPYFRPTKGTSIWDGRLAEVTLPAGDPVVEALSAIAAFDAWQTREHQRPTFDPQHRSDADRLDPFRRPHAKRQLVDTAIAAMLARGGVRYPGIWQTYHLRRVGEVGVFRLPRRVGRNLQPFAGQVVWVLCVAYLSPYANREYVAAPVFPGESVV